MHKYYSMHESFSGFFAIDFARNELNRSVHNDSTRIGNLLIFCDFIC